MATVLWIYLTGVIAVVIFLLCDLYLDIKAHKDDELLITVENVKMFILLSVFSWFSFLAWGIMWVQDNSDKVLFTLNAKKKIDNKQDK